MLANLLNKPGGRVSKSQQDEVLELIRNNDRSITVVDCGKDVEDDFIVELCQALASNRYVTTLRIRDKEVSTAMFPLATLCKKTTTLVSIKISYANLSDEDVQVLFLSLLKNTSVQSLALDHNRMTTADAVVKLLTFNKNIDSLDLSFNNLGARGDESLNAIADALGANRTLKQLYLSGNGMSDACARRFVQVIDTHIHAMQLRVLDIAAENSVRPETKQSLKLVLETARQSAAPIAPTGRRTMEDDDRSHQPTAAVAGGGAHTARSAAGEDRDGDTSMSCDDVKNWQDQVDAAHGRFDDERKDLLAMIERLKGDKEQLASGQIAALEQTNKLQQQVALLTERSLGLQRDLDLLTVKHEKKIRESTDQLSVLQTQVTAARRELVRSQELAANDRSSLVAMQEGLTQELTALHAQLTAAVRADDLIENWNHRPPTTRTLVVSIGTTTDGLKVPIQPVAAPTKLNANAVAGGASSRPSDEGNDAWSDDTDAAATTTGPTRSQGQGRAAPAALPRDQWLDDDATDDCRGCRERFTMTRRRHHCRLCGRVFCGRCAPDHKSWNMRACTFCIATHN